MRFKFGYIGNPTSNSKQLQVCHWNSVRVFSHASTPRIGVNAQSHLMMFIFNLRNDELDRYVDNTEIGKSDIYTTAMSE